VADFGGGVFETSTKNRSSLEASLGFAANTGTPRIENGGIFAVDFADGRRDRHNFSSGLMRVSQTVVPWQAIDTAVRVHMVAERFRGAG
jgi:hypothetical protein